MDLVEERTDGTIRCGVCQWGCEIAPRGIGRCLVRSNDGGRMVSAHAGVVSGAQIGRIEDHRLWHFFPGTPVLAVGSYGYALPADQERGPYALLPDDPRKRRTLDAERMAEVALERLCRGVVWGFGDPSVSAEYLFEVLQTCRANSRYTAMVTSGYHSIASLDGFGPYLDGMCLELRGFDDGAYRRLGGLSSWRGILDLADHARRRWGVHIEVLTRLHPGVNDSSAQLDAMARWIAETLGGFTVWHTLPGDAGSEAAAAVARARRSGREAGLLYMYGGEAQQPTLCPKCGALAIDRSAGPARTVGLDGGRCAGCGYDLHVRTSIFK